MLSGYKTYILGGLSLLSVVLFLLGWVSAEQLAILIAILLPAEGMALRAGVKKLEGIVKAFPKE